MASYDAIIVGTRCAGAALAMLVARAGFKIHFMDVLGGTLAFKAFFNPANLSRLMRS